MKNFFNHVDVFPNDECLHWTGKKDKGGYGVIGRRIDGRLKMFQAHRYIYAASEGKEIAKGMVLDHSCRNRDCVNPFHLRCVTLKMNALENSNGLAAINSAKTHCHRGHAFTEDNTNIELTGTRRCRICRLKFGEEYREKNREKIRIYYRKYRAERGV